MLPCKRSLLLLGKEVAMTARLRVEVLWTGHSLKPTGHITRLGKAFPKGLTL